MQRGWKNLTHDNENNQSNGNRHRNDKDDDNSRQGVKNSYYKYAQEAEKNMNIVRKEMEDINKENGTSRGENTKFLMKMGLRID